MATIGEASTEIYGMILGMIHSTVDTTPVGITDITMVIQGITPVLVMANPDGVA